MYRLTMERERRGWSRAELGRRANIHPADIGKFESGRLVPYPSQQSRLAQAIGISAEKLFEEVKCEWNVY